MLSSLLIGLLMIRLCVACPSCSRCAAEYTSCVPLCKYYNPMRPMRVDAAASEVLEPATRVRREWRRRISPDIAEKTPLKSRPSCCGRARSRIRSQIGRLRSRRSVGAWPDKPGCARTHAVISTSTGGNPYARRRRARWHSCASQRFPLLLERLQRTGARHSRILLVRRQRELYGGGSAEGQR